MPACGAATPGKDSEEAGVKSGGKSSSINRMKKNDAAASKEKKRKEENEVVQVDKKRTKNAKKNKNDGSASAQVEKKDCRKDDKKKGNTDKKKTGNNNVPSTVARSIGSCSFPMSRVWRLVRSEGGNSAINDSRTTHDAIFLINKASEMFLEQFTEDAYANAMQEHTRSIAYRHLSSIIPDLKRYDFLSEFVPERLRAEDALKGGS